MRASTCPVCWLGFGFVFLEYREPRLMAALFGALVVAAAIAA